MIWMAGSNGQIKYVVAFCCLFISSCSLPLQSTDINPSAGDTEKSLYEKIDRLATQKARLMQMPLGSPGRPWNIGDYKQQGPDQQKILERRLSILKMRAGLEALQNGNKQAAIEKLDGAQRYANCHFLNDDDKEPLEFCRTAFRNLGLAYLSNVGSRHNDYSASEALESGAKLGDVTSMRLLGQLYRTDGTDGFRGDMRLADKWLGQAAALGDREAAEAWQPVRSTIAADERAKAQQEKERQTREAAVRAEESRRGEEANRLAKIAEQNAWDALPQTEKDRRTCVSTCESKNRSCRMSAGIGLSLGAPFVPGAFGSAPLPRAMGAIGFCTGQYNRCENACNEHQQ